MRWPGVIKPGRYATRDGVLDARQGRPAYFWNVLFTPGNRIALLRESWNAELRVIGLAAVIDVIYQLMVFGAIHPVELVTIVLALPLLPYMLLRGPINRIARAWMTRHIRS